MSTILVIQKDARLRFRWRQALEQAAHTTVGAASLTAGLSALGNGRFDGLVVGLGSSRDVDVLRHVASLRELPTTVVVCDGQLPALPLRAPAACLLRSRAAPKALHRTLVELTEAAGDHDLARRPPFRLPPPGACKWLVRVFSAPPPAIDCDDTIPGNLAA